MAAVRAMILAAVTGALALAAAPAAAFDPAYEAANYAKINERARTDYTPEFNALLAERGLSNQAASAAILASDGPGRQYGRDFSGNLCANPMNGCAGDVRLYDWGEKGFGVVRPVLFTARNGSTLSGHVWMTAAGPRRRPGVVITNGSVQAPETLYWFAAQTLAKAGYVVLTWDPQGQGMSDTYGDGVDRNDGVPSQAGRPFYDGTEDALDFFFSTPADPYVPRPSCTTGTSHADKQAARVADGRSSAFNPFHATLDTARVGLVGHSLGAGAVSYVGQLDPRVDAVVAYDNLRDPSDPDATAPECASGSSPRPSTVAITKPPLGLSADYGLVPQPFTADPDAAALESKQAGSVAASAAGVDSGELVIRGGTHYEFSYIPNPAFGATRRGMDMVAWYTGAWMDKYLRRDRSADARLLTTRWNDDRLEREVDGQVPPDGNLYSTYFPSRLDIALRAGGRFTCEDLRAGCSGQGADGLPPDYSFLATAQTPDSATTPGSSTGPGGAPGAPPAARCTVRSRITRLRRHRRTLQVRGTAGRTAGCPTGVTRVLVGLRRGDRTRIVRARGTRRWRARTTVTRGRYRVFSRARAGRAIEPRSRGRRVRVR
jgi:dienelactone hydrolase